MSHQARVEAVAAQVIATRSSGAPAVFAKKSVSHVVPDPHRQDQGPVIDLSELDHVLEVDVEGRTCTAESGVTFKALVEATLPHGLVPKVVPELEGITLGGAVSGCSVESMSYKYGGFHDSALEYEVVTGQGQILTLTPSDDHFHLVHGSYGTLGILTRIRFELVPARPFVRVENRLHTTWESFWEDLTQRCELDDHDMVDGIIHGPDHFVLCVADFVEEARDPSSYDLDIYYKSTLTRTVDHLRTQDYFFRYDRECHWLTATIPGLENKLVRRLVGPWVLGSTNLIKWSDRLAPVLRHKRRPEVVVDVFIPDHRVREFFEWYEDQFQFWPLWIVPYKMPDGPYPWVSDEHRERVGTSFVIDCAIYGKPNDDPEVDWSEELERKVYELGGVKTLISRNHYDADTFWKIYARERIDAAKERLDPENLFGTLEQRFVG